jgi:adenine-specific DNA methylase
MGVLIEELRALRPEILKVEGTELGEAVSHLLAMVLDKFGNHNCCSNRWENTRAVIKGRMDRHDYAFKPAFAELAPCIAGAGLDWAIDNVVEAFDSLAGLAKDDRAAAVSINLGSATSLAYIPDDAITAVIVDPPYADNVQYSELADFFYVWLKRTQGHRRPEWFSTYLCEHDQEAVVNVARFRDGKKNVSDAKAEANRFYQGLMTDTFRECRRILRDDGVLTVMFTHKKQEAWEALFTSLIRAGFTITATWPVKTESEHSLHQARKNAAQSTVILVARKRPAGAGVGYFDHTMEAEIRDRARSTAERLRGEGLNAVDQLVGSFGPAIEVYSRHDEVRTDTGQPVGVDKAIDLASDAVSKWRIEQLAARGLDGVEAEGQFYLLCWDVLGAAEFRFNEAKLLGHAVGMDVDQLVVAGLVSKGGDKIKILSARERRRDRALEPDQVEELLFGRITVPKKRTKKDVLKVHPNDPRFRTALDACHALALRYVETGGKGGVGAAKALARQQHWTDESNVARLMQALVNAAPEAVKFEKGSTAALFPEFRAWHALLPELFGIASPEWKEKEAARGLYGQRLDGVEEKEPEDEADEETEDEAEGEE